MSMLTCASRRENEKTPKDQTSETYHCFTSGRENVIEKRQMAQDSHIAVDQKHDRCPRMRTRAPEAIDLTGYSDEVIIIKNDFLHGSDHFLEGKSERTVSCERGSVARPEPERGPKLDEINDQRTGKVHIPKRLQVVAVWSTHV